MLIKRNFSLGVVILLFLGGTIFEIGRSSSGENLRNPNANNSADSTQLDLQDPTDSLLGIGSTAESGSSCDSSLYEEFYKNRLADDTLTYQYLGSFLWGRCKDVKVVDNLAYCTFGPGLIILDVSDPAQPVLISRLYLKATCEGLDVDDKYAYITAGFAWGTGALMIVDITDPYHPRKINQEMVGYGAWNVKVVDSVIYLCAGDQGLRLYRINNVGNPYFVGSYFIRNSYNVEVIDTLAFAVDYNNPSLIVLNVSYPPAIGRIGSVALDHYATSVKIRGNLAFVTINYFPDSYVDVIDISDLKNPDWINTYVVADRYAYDIEFHGDIAYIACGTDPIVHIVDFSDPLNPVFLSEFETGIDAWNVEIKDDLLYCAAGGGLLCIADISDPQNPTQIGQYCDQAPGYASCTCPVREVKVKDNQAEVYMNLRGFQSVDIADPVNPLLEGMYELYFINRIFRQRNLAYVAGKRNGLRIIDISTPTEPEELSYVITDGQAFDVVVRDNIAYTAVDTAGVQIFDVSNPHEISELGAYSDIYTAGMEAKSIEVTGNLAYVGDQQGLQILDVSDPDKPVALGRCDTPARVRDLVVRDTIAYLAAHTLVTASIADPENPYVIDALVGLCADPYEVELYGQYAFIVQGSICMSRSIMAVDISDPANLQVAGCYDTPGDEVVGFDMEGRHLYAGDVYCFLSLYVDLPYVCGDVDNNDEINILDIIFLVDYKFKNGPAPDEPKSADVNGDGLANVLDIVYLINYKFKDGPYPICI